MSLDLEVVVSDQVGNRLTAIPVYVHVIPSNDPLLGTTSQYNLTPENTNDMGTVIWSGVQAGAQFQAAAVGSPDYTTGVGETSTTLTSGGYIEIVLSKVTQPTSGNTCPSGFTYSTATGQCVQNSSVGTASIVASATDWITKYWWVFAIILVVIVIGIVVMMITKQKTDAVKSIGDKIL